MKTLKIALLALLALSATLTGRPQDRIAPDISGMAVQGKSVNLEHFKGRKNVLLVFYRMHQ